MASGADDRLEKLSTRSLLIPPPPLLIPTYEQRSASYSHYKIPVDVEKLRRIQIKLHNYGDWQDSSMKFLDEKGSSFMFHKAPKVKINTPSTAPQHIPAFLGSPETYYVGYLNQIKSQGIYAGVSYSSDDDANAQVVLEFNMEEHGVELRFGCYSEGSPCEQDKQKYKGHISDFVIKVFLTIAPHPNVAYKTRLNLAKVEVEWTPSADLFITANVNFSAMMDDLKADLESALFAALQKQFKKEWYKNSSSKGISDRLLLWIAQSYFKKAKNTSGLNEVPTLSEVTDWVKKKVNIVRYAHVGKKLVVWTRYPTWITKEYVKIDNFFAMHSQMNAICPYQFGFIGEISTGGPVLVSVYVELVGKGRKSAIKNVLFTTAKTGDLGYYPFLISGPPLSKTQGYARLVVQFVGVFGQLYTRKSGKYAVFMNGTCSDI
ncbi:hypothetical protein NDN08_004582 [Rhodosorus marinus]|uniref:Uncharacterized protein n=1 Tax=Rhodosorus marinus TaxID=101924 RepID=A0AAV8ULN6_9RHOD|nr:hypothetical protein NDN08_004582 [Rhodosorus marinus]